MSAPAAPSMPPLWPLDETHLHHDYCWRCDSHRGLVHDPMMPPGDPIQVCPTCARERNIAIIRVKGLGPDFVPVRRPSPTKES